MDALIIRTIFEDKQTLGKLLIFENQNIIYECFTLELAWKNNKKRISCIPEGKYGLIKFNSPKFGNVYLLQNVPNRSMIEIHSGNYHTQILGCILPGQTLTDINGDGYRDVTSSKKTLKKLLEFNLDTIKITSKKRIFE